LQQEEGGAGVLQVRERSLRSDGALPANRSALHLGDNPNQSARAAIILAHRLVGRNGRGGGPGEGVKPFDPTPNVLYR